MVKSIHLLVVIFIALALSGCQELRGPVWTSDSRHIAYTSYTQSANGILDTSVYTVDADDDGADQQLVAKGAACPNWLLDNATLYYIGDRDQQGFYTKVFKTKVGPNAGDPLAALSGQRLTGFQMSADSSVAMLVSGRDPRPGSGCFIDMWDPATGKINSLRTLQEVYSPALLADGRSVAFSTKTGDKCIVWICDLATGSKPVPIFPTADQDEVSAAPFVVHAFPSPPGDRLLFYAPGGSNVFTIRRNGDGLRRYPLPDGVSSPLIVRIADENSATLTMAQISAEKISFQAYRLDFIAKKFTPVDDPAAVLIGGHNADPRSYHHTAAPRYAWLSPAGMALGEAGKARYFPTTASEYLAASALQLRQGEADKALQSVEKAREFSPGPEDPGELDRAESRASLATKQYEHASEIYEHAILQYPIGSDGLRFLFPPSSGLPRPIPTALNAQLKEMDELIKATPANQKLPLLRQALALRIEGKQDKALEVYPKVIPFCSDQSQVAGLRFQEALCQFEIGDLALAGEKWESAARVADFPQAQYAAGLAAVTYVLDSPHADVVPKAVAALALPAAKSGPLSAELAQLLNNIKGKAYREREKSAENRAPDGPLSAWVEYDHYYIPFASLKPQRVYEKGAKPTEQRVGARPITVSAIWLNNGAQDPIYRVPFEITSPLIAPGSKRVAFSATGDVFPLEPKPCEVYVIDLRGTLVMGDALAVSTGQLSRRLSVSGLSWNDANELKISGSVVDVFGGETAYGKNLLIPAAPVAPFKP